MTLGKFIEFNTERFSRIKSRETLLWVWPLALTIAMPTKTYGNIGFVDPNLYIGMALDYSWFLENTQTEYHATRIPFIYFLKILLWFPNEYVGVAFKAILLFGVYFFWINLAKFLNIAKIVTLSVSPLILLSPTVISATSWTVEQSFSFTLMLIIFGYLLTHKKLRHYVLLGLLMSILLNSNMYFFGLMFISLILFAISDKNMQIGITIRKFLVFSCGLIFGVLLIQVVWQIKYNNKLAPFWILEHFEILNEGLSGKTKGFGEWRNLESILSSNPWLIISLVCLTLISSYFVVNAFKYADNQYNCYLLSIVQFVLLITSWITYFIGINPQFDSYWYFYPNAVTLFFVLALCLKRFERNMSNSEISRMFLIASAICTYVIMFVSSGQFPRIIFVIVFAILLFSVSSLKASKLVKRDNLINLCLVMIISFSWTSNFMHPAFANSYIPNSGDSYAFLEDQRQIMKFVSKQRGKVLTWTPPDTSGYFGGLISTLGFHTTRLEGKLPSEAQPYMRNITQDQKQIYLTLIVPNEYKVNWTYIKDNQFQILKTEKLTSSRGEIYELKLR